MNLKLLFFAMGLFLVATDSAHAKCAMFDFYGNLSAMENIVHVRIDKSVIPDCTGFGDASCNYTFSADVQEVLKGAVHSNRLHFSYNYWRGCPGVITFQEGEEYILSIFESNKDGSATLSGVNCGRWGLPAAELEKLRESLIANGQ